MTHEQKVEYRKYSKEALIIEIDHLLDKFENEIRAKVINEIISKAHCANSDCFECAFGDEEKGCLLKGV